MPCYKCFTPTLALTASLLVGWPVGAADVAEESPPLDVVYGDAGWTFSIAPYFWAASLKGDIAVRGRQPFDADIPFRDIFDNLRFGGMIVGEAHNGTWGVFADLIYLDIEVDKSLTRTIAGVPVSLSGSLDTTSVTATLMGEYRVLAQPSATLDLMAGARIWSVDNELDIALSAGGPPLAAFSGSDRQTWVDPMLGVKGRVDLSSSWHLTGWGMIGGFGVASDFSWDVLGAIGYQWTQSLSIVGGYRAVGVDYSRDGFTFDVIEHGPILGAVIRF
ncbi:hypothetical protein SM0020_10910 [Sinorhizobium meliloti CCNWSX0020]|uniref:Outer membrane protein beta-barrel domain-containing protein n=1 Tax=Sinorhizobium meliloti CCNWSX0020 TaxID=1107881 RepID=H0FYA6_RHIML|nr:hypothetical protein [Sinorhizobium meliloti]EHK77960.1 hypothetical protein SM0020_10910 [Sinorhizobium meliloti CCNWSX0020]RVG73144.1 hypothetical protein CN220_08935 [Sinorhizobium meliloti]